MTSNKQNLLSTLTDLVLDGFDCHIPAKGPKFPRSLLFSAANSLQHLHIKNDSNRFTAMALDLDFWPMMPCLKTLRVESSGQTDSGLEIVRANTHVPLWRN